MKKLVYLLFATLLFSSCEKDELFEQSHQGGTVAGNLPEVLYATIADEQEPQSRTYVATNKQVMWQPGDEVSFFYGKDQNACYYYNGEYSDSKVQLTLKEHGKIVAQQLNYSRGIYPYDPGITIDMKGGID
jgi:hypothetical protein